MKVSREKLLSAFEAVSPGLASRELIEQSSCLVFRMGRVCTFNDEVACSIESPLPNVEGAVVAKPLMALLSKLSEDEIDVEIGDGKFKVKGKGRRAEVVMDAEVSLPVDSIDAPGDWVKLGDDFLEALSIVQSVAATNKDANFNLTCVHLHPEHIEACDNFQAARYPLETGLTGSCLVRQAAVRHVSSLGMVEVSEGPGWLHFRNAAGLMLSCRRWQEEYEDLTAIFDCEGTQATLPGGLAEAVDKAQIFSGENVENDQVFIRMKAGKLLIRGEGASGKFEEHKSVKFDGDVSFLISPKLLVEITRRTQDCVIGPGRLKVSTGKFIYVSCLGASE